MRDINTEKPTAKTANYNQNGVGWKCRPRRGYVGGGSKGKDKDKDEDVEWNGEGIGG